MMGFQDLKGDHPISINCPWCKKHVALIWLGFYTNNIGSSRQTSFSEPIILSTQKGGWSIAECPACHECVIVKMKNYDIIHILPNPLPSPTDERINTNIRSDLDEAKLCLSVGAFRACAGMCRRAIQQACMEQGADKKKGLEKQIDELQEKGIITSHISKWAHSSRFLGNDALHPEHPEVTEADAKNVLNLAEEMMKILYVMPAISKEVNANHERKK